MTLPNPEVKPEMEFVYAVDQQVSVNAFIEIEIDGEPVKFQLTNRYNSSAEKIAKTTKAAIEAFRLLRQEYPRAIIKPPSATIQVRDEAGLPVVDADHNPVMTTLPEGTHLFQVSGLAHDQTKNGKDVLKVWTVEEPYNKGYGVSCFHPPAEVGAWKSWPLMGKEKTRYAPPTGCGHVLIRDAQGEGKYPDVVEFRA